MRVLLARTGALGDLLLLRPALARLRLAGHAVTLLAPARTASLLVGADPALADRLLDADSAVAASLFAGQLPEPWMVDLRGCQVAAVYSRSDELAQALSRAIADVRRQSPVPSGRHASDWLCQPIEDLCPAADQPLPDLAVDRGLALHAGAEIAIHPGSGSPPKNWPAARFRELVETLGAPRCLWVRGPADEGIADAPRLARALDSPTLPALAATLAQVRMYVGNDSGVTHLAAAVGTPTVALFGPTDPALWAPRGRHVRVLWRQSRRLEDLSVPAVATAAREIFEGRTRGSDSINR